MDAILRPCPTLIYSKGEQHLKSVLRERKEEKCNLLPHLLHIHSLGLIIHLGLTLGKHTQPICFEKPLLMNSPVLGAEQWPRSDPGGST